MAGLTEQEVIELKHSLAGTAELCKTFYDRLVHEGFSEQQSLYIMTSWLSAIVGGAITNGD